MGRSTKNEGLWENQPKEWENRWGDFPARHLLTPEVHGSSAASRQGNILDGQLPERLPELSHRCHCHPQLLVHAGTVVDVGAVRGSELWFYHVPSPT